MAKFSPEQIESRGDIVAKIRRMDNRIRRNETDSRLGSSSFSRGNLRVAEGSIVEVDDGGDVVMNGGGGLKGNDGANVELMHPGNGVAAVQAGTLSSGTGVGYGIQINSSANQNILSAGQSHVERAIAMGDPQEPADRVVSYSTTVAMHTYSGSIYLNPDNGGLFVNIGSGGESTSPVVIDAGGRLWRGSSSLRYKTDVVDSRINPDAILELRPRAWRYKETGDSAKRSRSHGFIAEEVAEAGLGQAVVYDDDGQPDALDYNAITAGLVQLCQKQQSQIDELKNNLAALAARLEALEAPSGVESGEESGDSSR